MYSADQTRQLGQLTKKLLEESKGKGILLSQTGDLRKILQFHEYRYYIMDDPLVSDAEYDQLFKALEKLEAEHPDIVTPDSPTHRIARGLTKDFPTVQHLVPMLSLENSYNAEDLLDWDRKARELSGLAEIEYCVEPKFDGASISLI